MSDIFHPAQIVGYLAFVLGVSAFLQKSDFRFKFFNAVQCLAYAVHFFLLGNPAAALSGLVSSVRSFLALRLQGRFPAAVIVAVTLALGALATAPWWGYLTVGASCLSTVGVFTMRGVPLRALMLVCTGLWLINNILSGSIGGALLETFIGLANIATIVRLRRERRGRDPE